MNWSIKLEPVIEEKRGKMNLEICQWGRWRETGGQESKERGLKRRKQIDLNHVVKRNHG